MSAPFQLLPELTPEEFAALKADVAEHGILVPVVIDADSGLIIDGHHRLQAWTELRAEGLKVPDYPREVRRFATDKERIEFVVAANLFRRHLNRAQRAEVVARLRTEGWSLRRIGEVVGVDAATAFRDLAGVADATPGGEESATVTGRDDKRYPAHRPRPSPTIFVGSPRDAARAAKALQTLGDDASGLIGLSRAEERARVVTMDRIRSEAAEGPSEHSGETWSFAQATSARRSPTWLTSPSMPL